MAAAPIPLVTQVTRLLFVTNTVTIQQSAQTQIRQYLTSQALRSALSKRGRIFCRFPTLQPHLPRTSAPHSAPRQPLLSPQPPIPPSLWHPFTFPFTPSRHFRFVVLPLFTRRAASFLPSSAVNAPTHTPLSPHILVSYSRPPFTTPTLGFLRLKKVRNCGLRRKLK